MSDLLVLLAPPGRRAPTREVVSVKARASRFYCGRNSALVSTLHGHRDAENETSGKRRSETDGRGCERAMDRSGQLHRE